MNADTNRATLSKLLENFKKASKPSTQSYKYKFVKGYGSYNYADLDDFDKAKYLDGLKEVKVTVSDSIRYNSGQVWGLDQVLMLTQDTSYAGVDKLQRKVLYSTSDGTRPVQSDAYYKWNGFQVIDLDIKDEELAMKIRDFIFDNLKKLSWFFGVTLSSSHTGVHVYTKIQVPEVLGNDYDKLLQHYRVNFRHKYSSVYMCLLRFIKNKKYTKDDINRWMDMAMSKPQQGAFIGHDPGAKFSTHFFEDFLYVDFSHDGDGITHKDLIHAFYRWEFFDSLPEESEVKVKGLGDANVHSPAHYKYEYRWRLANTLVFLYGYEQGLKYLRAIVSKQVKDDELKSICQTAHRHKKGIDREAVRILNTEHGFKIDIDEPMEEENSLLSISNLIDNPNVIGKANSSYEIHLKENEYLGDKKQEIEENFEWLNLLEAGPGLGKTELVKSLARDGKRVMMVMPFTSTIKSKTEKDSFWKVAYGNKPASLDHKQAGMALTIDKFSRLSALDINTAGYDYIFIDESHLIFTSEYRDVMAPTLKLINNLEVPVVLMTGTPTGELHFFDSIHHIKVTKDDTRKKSLTVYVSEDSNNQITYICKHIMEDIQAGNRILFPTNEGNRYFQRIINGLRLLCDKEGIEMPKMKYYKRSNNGDDFMDDVNFESTIKDINILLCTNYLSVGVDILDRYNFKIYYSEMCMPAECDQWCNRLRGLDLHAALYIHRKDSMGNLLPIDKYQPLDLNTTDEEANMSFDVMDLCNDHLKRSRYVQYSNEIKRQLLNDHKYIRINDDKGLYDVDPIGFALRLFERKLKGYTEQIPVFIKGMMCYGYSVSVIELDNLPDAEDFKESIGDMLQEYQRMIVEQTENMIFDTTQELIGVYIDVLGNKYDLKVHESDEMVLTEDTFYVPNIEVFNKVAPMMVSLNKRFDLTEVKEIMNYCRTESGRYNFAAMGRLRTLFRLIDNRENEILDMPICDFMDRAYMFSERSRVYKGDIDDFLYEFISNNHEFRTETMKDKLIELYKNVFKCLIDVSRPDMAGYVTMKRVEVLWKSRMEKHINPMDGFILSDFIEQTITILNK